MKSKTATDVLAASAAFLERTMDEERAEIVERLCASAAPALPMYGGAPFDWPTAEVHGVEWGRTRSERAARIDFFRSDYELAAINNDDAAPMVSNLTRFPDLYGEWVYQP